MAKKSLKSRAAQTVNIEINYEKLAEAIIVVEEKARTSKRQKPHSRIRVAIMSFINGSFYLMVAMLCLFKIIEMWQSYLTNQGESSIASAIVLTILLIFIVVFLFLAQQESLCDDLEEAQEHFTANVSVAAFIVALCVLVKTI